MATRSRLRPLGREFSRPRKKPILTENASVTVCSYMNSYYDMGHGVYCFEMHSWARPRSSTVPWLRIGPWIGCLVPREAASERAQCQTVLHVQPDTAVSSLHLERSKHLDLAWSNSASPLYFQTTNGQFSAAWKKASKERQEFTANILYLYGSPWQADEQFSFRQ